MKKQTLVIILLAVLVVSCLALTACHTCEFGEWTVVKQPTCTQDGSKERVCECGEKETEVVPATGHTEGDWVTDVEATCSQAGVKHQVCATCGTILSIGSIEKSDKHNDYDGMCTLCGDKLYSSGLVYTLSDDGASCIVSSIGACIDIDIVIPATHKGKPVTSIGYGAFIRCKSLTSITIPSSVTSIGDFAFSGCRGLTSITIPDSVTSIGIGAFEDCLVLRSITIPDSVTSIGEGAFYNCSGLISIIVDANNPNYQSIDGNLYTKDGKTLIKYAVAKTDTSFIIPSSVTSIRTYAFQNCTSIISITIPNSVTSICEGAFDGCSSLVDVYYTGTQEQWGNISIGSDNERLSGAFVTYNYIEHNHVDSNNDEVCDICGYGEEVTQVAYGLCHTTFAGKATVVVKANIIVSASIDEACLPTQVPVAQSLGDYTVEVISRGATVYYYKTVKFDDVTMVYDVEKNSYMVGETKAADWLKEAANSQKYFEAAAANKVKAIVASGEIVLTASQLLKSQNGYWGTPAANALGWKANMEAICNYVIANGFGTTSFEQVNNGGAYNDEWQDSNGILTGATNKDFNDYFTLLYRAFKSAYTV